MKYVTVIASILLGGFFIMSASVFLLGKAPTPDLPKDTLIGLLIIGPITVNILAFHQFVAKDGIFQLVLLGVALVSLYLLWAERSRWKALVG